MTTSTQASAAAMGETVDWRLRASQAAAVLRLELKRILIGRRSLGVLIFSLFPAVIAFLTLLFSPAGFFEGAGGEGVVFAVLFRTVYLRLIIFFGCVLLFTNLFRGEVLEGTLHYYFLAPMPRWVLVVGKFVGGVFAAFLTFFFTTAATFLLLHANSGVDALGRFLSSGPGAPHLAAYALVTLMAVIGYGAVFLLAGLAVRNPIIPAVLIYLWESMNPFMPVALKQMSVIYYLESLCPVPIPQHAIAILADPAPAWLSLPGLAVLTALLLWAACARLRHYEIRYGAE